MFQATSPFFATSGPRNAKIAIVGEAWGKDEAFAKMPFIGQAGQELFRMLKDAGISRKECFLTNVFNVQPEKNEIENLCGSKAEVGKDYSAKPLRMGKYFLPQYLPEVERLKVELTEVKPNLIIALGNTASWALLGQSGISKIRGTISSHPLGKVLPTYHPAAVLRNWALRPIVMADLLKAAREKEFPEIRRPECFVTVSPTLGEIEQWYNTHAIGSQYLSCDIETKRRQIEMVGFASSPQHSLVIPFIDFSKPGNRYWESVEQEVKAWEWVRKLLALPQPKVFQNGLYDLQYLLPMGLVPVNCTEDTMLLAHSLYPEMPKGLGFLGSVFTDHASWKLMRGKGHDEFKRDE